MTTAMWIGLAWWDFVLAMATFGLYHWSAFFGSLAARQGTTQRGQVYRAVVWSLRVAAGCCVALLVLFTIVATSDAR